MVVVFVLPGTEAGAWVPRGGIGITPVVPAEVAEGVMLFGTLELTAAAPDDGRPRPAPVVGVPGGPGVPTNPGPPTRAATAFLPFGPFGTGGSSSTSSLGICATYENNIRGFSV